MEMQFKTVFRFHLKLEYGLEERVVFKEIWVDEMQCREENEDKKRVGRQRLQPDLLAKSKAGQR